MIVKQGTQSARPAPVFMEAAARHDLECVLANPDYFLRPAKCPPPEADALGEWQHAR